MTNRELIKELQKLNPEHIVCIWDWDSKFSYILEGVEDIEDEDNPGRKIILLS